MKRNARLDTGKIKRLRIVRDDGSRRVEVNAGP
jgi:hypothetical protein